MGFFLDTLHDEILATIDRIDKGKEVEEVSSGNGEADEWMEVGSKGRTATTRTASRGFGWTARAVANCLFENRRRRASRPSRRSLAANFDLSCAVRGRRTRSRSNRISVFSSTSRYAPAVFTFSQPRLSPSSLSLPARSRPHNRRCPGESHPPRAAARLCRAFRSARRSDETSLPRDLSSRANPPPQKVPLRQRGRRAEERQDCWVWDRAGDQAGDYRADEEDGQAGAVPAVWR